MTKIAIFFFGKCVRGPFCKDKFNFHIKMTRYGQKKSIEKKSKLMWKIMAQLFPREIFVKDIHAKIFQL